MKTDLYSFPRCCIVLCTFNPNHHLLAQVESLISQKNVDVDIFISDDSLDHSFLQKYLCIHPRFSKYLLPWIEGPRLKSAAANFFFAVNHASKYDYDYYALCDQDDIWMPDKLFKAISAMADQNADCYSSELLIWNEKKSLLTSKSSAKYFYKNKLFGYFFAESAGCTMVFNKKALKDVDRFLDCLNKNKICFSRIFSHDLFLSVFLHCKGYKWFHDTQSYIYYRQHENNAWGAHDHVGISSLWARFTLLVSGAYFDLLSLAHNAYPLTNCHGSFLENLFYRLKLINLSRKVFSRFCLQYVGFILFALMCPASLMRRLLYLERI